MSPLCENIQDSGGVKKGQKAFPAFQRTSTQVHSRRTRLEVRHSGAPLRHLPGTIIIKVTPNI